MDTQTFVGKVEKGKGYGRTIGYPTVNIFVPKEKLPKAGVYSGVVTVDNQSYISGIVVGPGEPTSPQAPEGQGKIEAHLLGYSGDAYGKEITIEIGKFIRDFKKFDTEDELKAHIESDLKML